MKKEISLEQIVEMQRRVRRRMVVYIMLICMLSGVFYITGAHAYWLKKMGRSNVAVNSEPKIPYEVPLKVGLIELIKSDHNENIQHMQMELEENKTDIIIKLTIETSLENTIKAKFPGDDEPTSYYEWGYLRNKMKDGVVWLRKDSDFRFYNRFSKKRNHTVITNPDFCWGGKNDTKILFISCKPENVVCYEVDKVS